MAPAGIFLSYAGAEPVLSQPTALRYAFALAFPARRNDDLPGCAH
jgi:hypothetical protein